MAGSSLPLGPKQGHRCYTASTKPMENPCSPSTHKKWVVINITPQKVLKQSTFQSYFRIISLKSATKRKICWLKSHLLSIVGSFGTEWYDLLKASPVHAGPALVCMRAGAPRLSSCINLVLLIFEFPRSVIPCCLREVFFCLQVSFGTVLNQPHWSCIEAVLLLVCPSSSCT